jgi:hypothetical protein
MQDSRPKELLMRISQAKLETLGYHSEYSDKDKTFNIYPKMIDRETRECVINACERAELTPTQSEDVMMLIIRLQLTNAIFAANLDF